MKGLFGFLFAISLALTLGCLYLRAELQQALKVRDNLRYKLQAQERKFQQRIAQAVAHCEAEQKRFCNRQVAAAERIAFRRGEIEALEKCAAKVEQAVQESVMQSERYFTHIVNTLKSKNEQNLSHDELFQQVENESHIDGKKQVSATVSELKVPAKWSTKEKSLYSGFLLKRKRMNWFVMVMILLSPLFAGAVQRLIAGKRGFM